MVMGTVISEMFTHPLKGCPVYPVRESGRVTLVSELLSANALSPMEATLLGRVSRGMVHP